MKFLSLLFFILIALTGEAQKVVPLVDFSGYFKSFQDGFFRQVEFQRVSEFKYGDNVVGYYDNRGNLRVFNGDKPKDIANVKAEYEVSDNLLVWKIGNTLNLWDEGRLSTLSYNVDRYVIKDSLVVFLDTRYNAVKTYYNGQITTLYSSVSDIKMPDFIGENIIAFRDNGNFYKVFWRGMIYDLDVWHNPILFEGGTDILAFNDPINGTFAIFENGEFLDVEMFHVGKYRSGNKIMVYEDLSQNLVLYTNGTTEVLSNFGASFWEVKDGVVIWGENNFTYAWVNGKKIELARYKVNDYALKNDVIAFRNLMGGVSCMDQNGEIHELTNQMESTYTIHGNSVLVHLFNSSFLLFHEGRTFNL